MAPESQEKQEQDQQRQQASQHDDANADATQREAYDYWGYLLKQDKCGTPLLDRLLKGIAQVISHKFEPSDSTDITPSQLAAWYRDVGGNYDVLFKETPPSSIAFIYRSLGAFHSLQPGPNDDGYASPAIPALKKQGFVTWQTIQLLLGPEEHVPFLQKTVEKYDVVDPDTGSTFPKILPQRCFPTKPDEAMETWYEGVADRLKREADEEAARERAAKQAGGRTSTDPSGDGSSADEKTGAFKYFEDPMNRRARARPTFMRHVSKQQAIYPIEDRGGARAVTQRVRHMLNPFHSKRRPSMPGRYESDDYSDEDATPVAINPPVVVPTTSHKRQHERRRQNSISTTDSESEGERAPSRSKRPDIYQRRSHEPMPPREYFPPYYEGDRRNSHQYYPSDSRPSSKATSPQPVWRPTTSPLFATQVAQMEARSHHDRRPVMPQRTSYRPLGHGVRWGAGSTPVSPPRENAPGYGRERPYESRDGDHRARHRRRSTEDAAYPFERDEIEKARTRSHDRMKDEWDDRDSSRSRQRKPGWDEDSDEYVRSTDHSREREHDRRRYVAGVQGGVTGRRYPVVNSGLGPY